MQNPGVGIALITANEQGSMMSRQADNPHSKWKPGPHFSKGGINGNQSEYFVYSIHVIQNSSFLERMSEIVLIGTVQFGHYLTTGKEFIVPLHPSIQVHASLMMKQKF